MSLRRLLRILEGSLLALLAAAHVLFWLHYPRLSASLPEEAELFRDAVLSAQVTLLAGLIVVGPGRWWLRQPIAVAFITAIVSFDLLGLPPELRWGETDLEWLVGYISGSVDQPPELRWGERLLAIEAGAVGLALLAQLAFGWRLMRWSGLKRHPDSGFRCTRCWRRYWSWLSEFAPASGCERRSANMAFRRIGW